MPFYEYQCDKCTTITTHLRSMSERHSPLSCPACGASTHLILSAFSTPHSYEPAVEPQSKVESPQKPSGGMQLKNVHIENCNVGISLPAGAQVDMSSVTFKDVKTPVEIRGKNE